MIRNYIKNHWAGQLGFGWTLFVNLIGLSFVISSLTMESWSDWVLVLAVCILTLLLIWQIVGGVRCANVLQKNQPGGSNAWALYMGVCVAFAMVGFQVLDVTANRFFIEPRAKTIFGNDDFSVRLKGDTLMLGGEVNYLMYQAIVTIIAQQDDVKSVSLDSHGGIVFAARSIAKVIEDEALSTHVEKQCYSACTLVFAAGNHRTISQHADIGFHGYSLDMPFRLKTVDPIEEQKKDQLYLIERGIDAAFLETAFSTDAKTLWKPDRQHLFDAGFITER